MGTRALCLGGLSSARLRGTGPDRLSAPILPDPAGSTEIVHRALREHALPRLVAVPDDAAGPAREAPERLVVRARWRADGGGRVTVHACRLLAATAEHDGAADVVVGLDRRATSPAELSSAAVRSA